MTRARLELGRRSEEAAREHLLAKRHRILATNVRSPAGELDIVTRLGATVVFVEVRSRTGSRYGSSLESVDDRKRRRLCRAAQTFLLVNRLEGVPVRFDVIGIEWRDGAARIDHVENAFECV